MPTNNTTPVSLDALAVGRSSTSPFITVFETRNPNSNDVNYPVQQRWYNQTAETEYILTSFSIVSEVKTAVWQPINASQVAAAETLTGNSGGAVAVDGSNNINVVGDTTTINIVGNPATHTLTASTTGSVATLYTEDSGSAVPVSNALSIVGGTNISTSGAGHTVTITNSIPYIPNGSFTPGIAFGGLSVGVTYSAQNGYYTKLGNLVFYQLSFILTSKGSSTGVATITGLPINSMGPNTLTGNPQLGSVTFSGNYVNIASISGTTTLLMEQTTSAMGYASLADTNFSNTSSVSVAGFYFTS